MVLKQLKKGFHNDVTKKGSRIMVIKQFEKRFLNNSTKKGYTMMVLKLFKKTFTHVMPFINSLKFFTFESV